MRELEHVLKRSMLTARGATLAEHDLVLDEPNFGAPADGAPLEALLRAAAESCVRAVAPSVGAARFNYAIATLERALARAAVEASGGSQAAAARLLGISRTTLRLKLGRPDAGSAGQDLDSM